MPKCEYCEADFFPPEGAAWVACADCLAAQIELAWLQQLQGSHRKPMRRTSGKNDSEVDALSNIVEATSDRKIS